MVKLIFGVICFLVLMVMLIRSSFTDKDGFRTLSTILSGVVFMAAAIFVPMFLMIIGKATALNIAISVATFVGGIALGFGVMKWDRVALAIAAVVMFAGFGYCLYLCATIKEQGLGFMAMGGALLSAILFAGLISAIRDKD